MDGCRSQDPDYHELLTVSPASTASGGPSEKSHEQDRLKQNPIQRPFAALSKEKGLALAQAVGPAWDFREGVTLHHK